MAKVRVRAWVEQMFDGSYRMHSNDGAVGTSTFDLKSVQQQVDYINNEDSEGRYIEVSDRVDFDVYLEEREEARVMAERKMAEREKRAEERRKKEIQKIENNRKSKKKSETYFYIISMIERGANKSTVYFSGETNLLTMKKFTVDSAEKSKVFNTKASAQKVVDTLENNRIIYKLYRNIKVVQKKKDLFS